VRADGGLDAGYRRGHSVHGVRVEKMVEPGVKKTLCQLGGTNAAI
jgi:hypothetical protein